MMSLLELKISTGVSFKEGAWSTRLPDSEVVFDQNYQIV